MPDLMSRTCQVDYDPGGLFYFCYHFSYLGVLRVFAVQLCFLRTFQLPRLLASQRPQ